MLIQFSFSDYTNSLRFILKYYIIYIHRFSKFHLHSYIHINLCNVNTDIIKVNLYLFTEIPFLEIYLMQQVLYLFKSIIIYKLNHEEHITDKFLNMVLSYIHCTTLYYKFPLCIFFLRSIYDIFCIKYDVKFCSMFLTLNGITKVDFIFFL